MWTYMCYEIYIWVAGIVCTSCLLYKIDYRFFSVFIVFCMHLDFGAKYNLDWPIARTLTSA